MPDPGPHRGIRPPTLDQARAVIVIGLVVRERGHGPTWAQLAAAVGWPQDQREERVRELLPVGVRWKTGQKHSLCLLPGVLEAALAAVRGREAVTA